VRRTCETRTPYGTIVLMSQTRPQRLVVGMLMLALTTACSGGAHHASSHRSASSTDGQQAFLYADGTTVLLVRWTNAGGFLTGTVNEALLTSDVNGRQEDMTGRLTGNAVSLTVNGETWTGSLVGPSHSLLTLHFPASDGSLQAITLAPGDIDAYNADVAALHGTSDANAQATADAENAANAAEAVATADRRLGGDLDNMASSLTGIAQDAVFTSDLASAAQDLHTARADYKTVQSDVNAHDCGSAGSDAGSVDSDAGSLDSDVGSIDSDVGSVESDVSSIQATFRAFDTDYAALKQASLASPSTPTEHNQAQVYAAIDKAAKAIKSARAAEASARAQVAALASSAHSLATKAQSLADHCS
jgi:hypothetical protein